MPADALAPKVARASADMVLAVQDRQHVLVFQSSFHLLGSSQSQDMIQNVNISFMIFKKQFSMLRVLFACISGDQQYPPHMQQMRMQHQTPQGAMVHQAGQPTPAGGPMGVSQVPRPASQTPIMTPPPQQAPSPPIRNFNTPAAPTPPPAQPKLATQATQPPPSPSMQVMMTMQQKQNRITPVSKPQGLDPVELLDERENRSGNNTTFYRWLGARQQYLRCI